MDYIILLNVGFLVGCVASALVSAWFARKNNVRELQNDVEEIAIIVEKIHRESKRQQMQRVRAAAESPDFPRPPGAPDITAVPSVTDKASLRRQVFGGKMS